MTSLLYLILLLLLLLLLLLFIFIITGLEIFFISHSVTSKFRSASSIFSVEWISHKVALKANNGKYVCTKKNGQLLAVSDSPGIIQAWMEFPLRPFSSPKHSLFAFTFFVRGRRTAHSETDQQTHADSERPAWIHLPPQELQHAGCQQVHLWHLHSAVQ